jgi:D-3-phosphoglycerate dehydrogenase
VVRVTPASAVPRPAGRRVAVTPRSLSSHGHPALDRLVQHGFELVYPARGRTPTPLELREALPTCDAYLAGVEPIPAELLRASPRLRVIARNGVGVNNIDLDAAAELGIAVVPAVGANSQGVAELAVALMFAGARHIPSSDGHLKSGEWARSAGLELAGRTLGVVGVGQIGRRVATMATGIGMRVLGYDAYIDHTWPPPASFEWSELDALFARSDVISLHAPPAATPLVDARRLSLVKPRTVLVNTARAELVDDDAVLDALNSDRLSSYAVDAFVTEPPTDLRLVRHPRVIATPHVGGFTTESVERATTAAVDAILTALTPSPA